MPNAAICAVVKPDMADVLILLTSLEVNELAALTWLAVEILEIGIANFQSFTC